MTNFEKIKQLTLEEFAERFNFSICRQITRESFDDCQRYDNNCTQCAIGWLNQEVKEKSGGKRK